jgi:hypothetical protein
MPFFSGRKERFSGERSNVMHGRFGHHLGHSSLLCLLGTGLFALVSHHSLGQQTALKMLHLHGSSL